jgi:hypothetical protein
MAPNAGAFEAQKWQEARLPALGAVSRLKAEEAERLPKENEAEERTALAQSIAGKRLMRPWSEEEQAARS